jgi:hypothetical protein
MTTKTGIHRHSSKRSAVFIATAVAALVTTTQFAEAAKADPAVTAAVTAATTTDIELIASLGVGVGDQIGSGAIKLSKKNVQTLAKGLADAVYAKIPTGLPIDVNRVDNKKDEVGEVAAFVFEAIAANSKMQKAKTADKNAILVMKSVLKNALKNTELLATTIISDVVSSVALTIHNDARLDGIEQKLVRSLTKGAKKVAGSKNKNIVKAALAAGFAGGATFEDGNIPTLTTIVDPETDMRNA